MALSRAIWLAALVSLHQTAASANPYVEQKDYDVSAKAAAKAKEACKEASTIEVDRADGRDALLDGAGGENVILNILKKSKNSDELGDNAAEELTPAWAIKTAGALVLAFIMIFIYLICCWTACPLKMCCRCCRCCVKVRKTHFIVKAILAVIMAGLLLGLIISASMALAAYEKSKEGFQTMECSSSKLLNTTLSGQVSPPFIGMVPLLETFNELDQSFADNSQLLTDISGVLDATKTINTAVNLVTAELQLLRDMLALPSNNRPTGAGGVDLLHQCDFCTGLTPVLDQVISQVNSGAGTALANVRTEVETQLSSSNRQDLQSSLRSTAQPMKEVKNLIRDSLQFLIDDDGFGEVVSLMEGGDSPVMLGAVGFTLFAGLILICGLVSSACFVFREKKNCEEGKNPYTHLVHRCACCTWCVGFWYTILALLLGGIMVAVATPLSGMCLIMADLDGQLLKDIGPGLNMDMSQGSNMMVDTIDKCIAHNANLTASNFLEILTVEENGQTVTMRTKIQKDTKDMLNQQFDALTANEANVNLANSTAVTDLRAVLRDTPVNSMMIPTPATQQSAEYQGLAQASDLQIGFATSTACLDQVVSSQIQGGRGGTTVKGMDNFVTLLENYGPKNDDPLTCADQVTCTDCSSPASPKCVACTAGNKLMQLKQKIQDATYRCDLFENPSNPAQYCDPKDMVAGGGSYSNDCLSYSNGIGTAATRKQRSCNLAQFTTYIQEFDERINKAMMRIDAETASTMVDINTGMRGLINTYIMGPIDRIVDGCGCGFLGATYREVVDGLCFQGVVGFRGIGVSYVSCGILTLLLVIVAYALWRRAIDNVNAWQHGHDSQLKNGPKTAWEETRGMMVRAKTGDLFG